MLLSLVVEYDKCHDGVVGVVSPVGVAASVGGNGAALGRGSGAWTFYCSSFVIIRAGWGRIR